MFVAQVTEPAAQGQHNEQYTALKRRFPAYQFSIMMAGSPFIIARPDPHTILSQDDECTEVEMLRFMVTSLIDELITGIHITDGQVEHVMEIHCGCGEVPGSNADCLEHGENS